VAQREKKATTVRTYRAGGGPSGIFSSLDAAANEIWLSRFVIWRLFIRDFVVQFRQKILGYFWTIIAPLLTMASFVFMNFTGILNPGDVPIPYPLFVFFGTSLWGSLILTVSTVSGGLLSQSDLVLRTNVPRIALALAGLGNVFYNVMVNLLVLISILLILRVTPSWWAVLYPLMILPIMALGIGIGLLLAVIGAVARDVTTIVVNVLGLIMYVTPVIYAADFPNPIVQKLVTFNPLTYLVDVSRNIFFVGKFEALGGFLVACGFSLIVFLLGIHGFYLIKDKVAERL
jgi:lipopolysaccharide transport system permease protein